MPPSLTEPRTERLLMRTWRAADREPFAAMNSDPEVMRYFPAPMTRAESDAFVDRIEGLFAVNGYGLWALEVAANGEFVGFTGLNPTPEGVPGSGGVEVGWRLAAHSPLLVHVFYRVTRHEYAERATAALPGG